MLGFVGIAVILVMVFGGYALAGGKMGIILKALPFEMIIIGGAAIGAFLISNDMGGVKHTMKDIGKVFKGPKWKTDDYRDLLCLLFELIRLARANPVALEEHIESPENSAIIAQCASARQRSGFCLMTSNHGSCWNHAIRAASIPSLRAVSRARL